MAPGPRRTLPDELVEEILIRIPPDDPASLLRASLVCKSWSEVVSHRGFSRRLRDHHRAPPVLGFLHDWYDEDMPEFIPATSSPFSLAVPDRRLWQAVDCRHGRALFLSNPKCPYTQELLMWEPITGARQRIPVPTAFQSGRTTAAVFCTADGCDHCHCHGGPFCVVFIFSIDDEEIREGAVEQEYVTSACIYSSETDAWGEPTLMHGECYMDFTCYSSVLVGRSLLYFLSDGGMILEYDLARHTLISFDIPYSCSTKDVFDCNLMLAENGGLGLVEELNPHLQLWSREVDARWVPSRIIYLGSLSLNGAPVDGACPVHVLGFAEGANVIVVTTSAGVYSIQVQSAHANKVCDEAKECDDYGYGNLIPVVGFYTPVPKLSR
ncbi:uncharacterized protein LOC123408560 [Hordeum vulgare subsp. vulgare]|uniref:F-box domain-containing protein n=1 Tax=Hordeum vulgare subsp. vulgare TaxID=112509 RepID=A0A8I6YEK3_HORVV|nr:uncharacterized protein LOC123408560 [Hordeum vulgare subsp. vulgare]